MTYVIVVVVVVVVIGTSSIEKQIGLGHQEPLKMAFLSYTNIHIYVISDFISIVVDYKSLVRVIR